MHKSQGRFLVPVRPCRQLTPNCRLCLSGIYGRPCFSTFCGGLCLMFQFWMNMPKCHSRQETLTKFHVYPRIVSFLGFIEFFFIYSFWPITTSDAGSITVYPTVGPTLESHQRKSSIWPANCFGESLNHLHTRFDDIKPFVYLIVLWFFSFFTVIHLCTVIPEIRCGDLQNFNAMHLRDRWSHPSGLCRCQLLI